MNKFDIEEFIKNERPSLDRTRYINKNICYKCYSTANERYIIVYKTNEQGKLTSTDIFFPSEYDYDIWRVESIDSYDLYKLERDYLNLNK